MMRFPNATVQRVNFSIVEKALKANHSYLARQLLTNNNLFEQLDKCNGPYYELLMTRICEMRT